MHALRSWSTNELHMFAVCAFKFLLPACFLWALRSFTSQVNSCSFPVSVLDKRVPGVYACDNNKFLIIELERAIRKCRGASSEV